MSVEVKGQKNEIKQESINYLGFTPALSLAPILKPMVFDLGQFAGQNKDDKLHHEDLKLGITRKLNQSCILFADESQKEKAYAIASYLPQLFRVGLMKWDTFPDKHINAIIEDSDQLMSFNKHISYLGTLYTPADIARQCIAISALSEQPSLSFTAEFPYMATGTHERVVRTDPYFDENHHQYMRSQGIATTKAVLKMIESCIATNSKMTTLRVCDFHTPGGAFYGNKFLRESTMVTTLLRMLRLRNLHNDPGFAIVFPDAGAAKKYKLQFQDIPSITCEKIRGPGQDRLIKIADYHLIMSTTKITNLWLIDDLVQSGSTAYNCFLTLKNIYPDAKISMWVTHPVFPNESHLHFLPGGKYSGFQNFFVCDTVPEVTKKLRYVGTPFVVMDTSPMMVQTYLEQFGWTHMAKDFYKPEKIAIMSKNNDKIEAVRRAFYLHFPFKENLQFISFGDQPSGVNEQPIGQLETLTGCENRLHGSIGLNADGFDYMISLERGLFSGDDKWLDQTCVIIEKLDGKGNALLKSIGWSRAFSMDEKYVLESAKTNYMKTAGSFLSVDQKCSSSDWYQKIHGISCIDIMQEVIQSSLMAMQIKEATKYGSIIHSQKSSA